MCWQANPTVCLLLGEAATKHAGAAQQKAVYRDKEWGTWGRGMGGREREAGEGEWQQGRHSEQKVIQERENMCVHEKEREHDNAIKQSRSK